MKTRPPHSAQRTSTDPRSRWRFLLGLIVLFAELTFAFEKGEFTAPGMEGFVKIQEYYGDGDDDGINETKIHRFKNLNGDRMFTMTSRNKLWAWSLDAVNDDDSAIERNYVLRDSDCDGRFDERYRLDQGFNLPDCLK